MGNNSNDTENFAGVKLWLRKQLNMKMGIIAGLCTGSIVYYINLKHGYYIAFTAFLKQFAYNFFMAGFNSSLCERLAKSISNSWQAIIFASVVPASIAFGGIYSVHYFLNTPNPLASTLWQGYANLIIFFTTGLAFHQELEKKYKWVRLLITSKKRIEEGFFD